MDDLLPVSRDGTLMCTFSTHKEELWSSIIEKAVSRITILCLVSTTSIYNIMLYTNQNFPFCILYIDNNSISI